jgi:single-strand DNA-binding protein
MLRVTVLGNLGNDATLRRTAKDTPIVQLSMAVNQLRTGSSGEREESTEWFRVNVTGRQADFAAHLQKGQRVLAIGRLQISHFSRRDGTQGTGFDVWADEVQSVSARSAGAESENSRAAVGATGGDVDEEPPDFDLPF